MPTLETRVYRSAGAAFPGEAGLLATVPEGVDAYRDAGAAQVDADPLYYWVRHRYGESEGPPYGPVAVPNPPRVASITAVSDSHFEPGEDGTITGGYWVYAAHAVFRVNARTKSVRVEYRVNSGPWYLLEERDVDWQAEVHSNGMGAPRFSTVGFRVTPFSGAGLSGSAGPVSPEAATIV